MRKLLLAGAATVLLLAVAALGYGVHLVRRLDTPEFQKALLEQAKATVGADVRVKEMDISLLSGVTLRGIVVANPAPFTEISSPRRPSSCATGSAHCSPAAWRSSGSPGEADPRPGHGRERRLQLRAARGERPRGPPPPRPARPPCPCASC